uniref:Uncharacterized protein n=1 Tax=Anopheles aquasalis TaxID=42839 RepID=T1DHU6_ANOAQ
MALRVVFYSLFFLVSVTLCWCIFLFVVRLILLYLFYAMMCIISYDASVITCQLGYYHCSRLYVCLFNLRCKITALLQPLAQSSI